jgi:hypothetical protein
MVISQLYDYITIHGTNNAKFVIIKLSDRIRIRNPNIPFFIVWVHFSFSIRVLLFETVAAIGLYRDNEVENNHIVGEEETFLLTF